MTSRHCLLGPYSSRDGFCSVFFSVEKKFSDAAVTLAPVSSLNTVGQLPMLMVAFHVVVRSEVMQSK